MSLTPIALADPEFDRIAIKVFESYPNACISRIEKVEMDPKFEERFQNRLKDFKEHKIKDFKEPDVRELFHGTKVKNVESILSDGFLVSKNVSSSLGKGTYFASYASYSVMGYTDKSKIWELSYVFLSDVILNDCNSGNRNHPGDNLQFICACRRDESCIPRYLISFYKDADKIK